MNDKIFGEVEYEKGAWKRDETIEVYGKVGILQLKSERTGRMHH